MADERPLDGRYFPTILRNRERMDEIEATRVAGQSIEQERARSADPVNAEGSRAPSPNARSSAKEESQNGEKDADKVKKEDDLGDWNIDLRDTGRISTSRRTCKRESVRLRKKLPPTWT
jgi:hypothetical protein